MAATKAFATTRVSGRPAPPAGRLLVSRLLISAAGLAAYVNSFRGVFVYDDPLSIVENPPLRSLWPTWPELWARRDTTLAGRPVAAFTFALNYAISGFEVWSYHLFNILIHVLAGLTLFGLLRLTLSLQSRAGRFSGSAEWFALAATLLWLLHPLQTEAVTYISTRTESLAGLFLLLTLYCAMRRATPSGGRGWSAAAVAACALGMGTKELMAVAPPLVLLFDRTFLAGSFKTALRQRAGMYSGLAATWLILAGLLALQPRSKSVGFHHPDLDAWQYLLTQFGVILHYLRLSIWPHPLVLCYDSWPIARSLTDVLPQAAAVLGLLGLTLWALWRKPPLGFLGAWFFVILAPTSSVVPIVTEIAAERRMYLPLAAVILLLTLASRWVLERAAAALRCSSVRQRAVAIGLVAVVAAAETLATVRRNTLYHSVEAVWQNVLRTCPSSPEAHLSLATELYKQGRTDEGIAMLRSLVQRDPGVWEAYYGLGHGYLRQNNLTLAAEHYGRAVQLGPNDYRARTNYGGVLALMGQHARAREQLEASLRLKPDQPLALFQLAGLYEAEGRLDEAARTYQRGLALDPNNATARHLLGMVLARQGHVAQAIDQLQQAIQLQPDLTEARANLERLRPASRPADPP